MNNIMALSSTVGLISTVKKKESIQQQRAYHAAKVEELDAELAAIAESRCNKRRRFGGGTEHK